MIIIAIDPGAKGGIAWRDEEGDVHVADLPTLTVRAKSKTKTGKHKEREEVDAWAIARLIDKIAGRADEVSVVIESLPQMSASLYSGMRQAGNHGRTIGAVEGWAAVRYGGGVDVRLVDPQKVRRFHGLKAADKAIPKNRRSDANKAANVAKALELFPDAPVVIPAEPTKSGAPSRRKPTIKDGRADALLMLAHHEHVLRRPDDPCRLR